MPPNGRLQKASSNWPPTKSRLQKAAFQRPPPNRISNRHYPHLNIGYYPTPTPDQPQNSCLKNVHTGRRGDKITLFIFVTKFTYWNKMCNDNLIVVDSYIPDQGKNLFCNVPIIGILHLQYGGRHENWDKPAEHTWLLWCVCRMHGQQGNACQNGQLPYNYIW